MKLKAKLMEPIKLMTDEIAADPIKILKILCYGDFLIGANYVNRRMNINLHTGLSKGRFALNLRRKLCEILNKK